VVIEVRANNGALAMSVADNGRGFAPEALATKQCFGIRGMRERASLLGGVLKITSEIGKGTETVLEIPRPPAMADIEAERMESA
jgi:signal transduction histidine kinase